MSRRVRWREALLRGSCAFLGLYLVAGAAVAWRSGGTVQDLWLLDLRFLALPLAVAVGSGAGALLLAYAFEPAVSARRRHSTVGALLVLAACAARNVSGFYGAWGSGRLQPWMPLPLSAVLYAWLIALALGVLRRRRLPARRAGRAAVETAAVFIAIAALFPLAQVAFFGTTDYGTRADAAVVLGARVHDNGAMSSSLIDRVDTGVALYRAGRVSKLIMSGAPGDNGIDESAVMRQAALARGVPASAVLADGKGDDTDSSVHSTLRIFEREKVVRVLAVSQFYHLPRIKLAYRAAGFDVATVPASARRYIGQTPLSVLREIPGFWVYWSRGTARVLLRGPRA